MKETKETNEIKSQLDAAGFSYAVAVATQAEIDAKAACGQLSMVVEQEQLQNK